MVLQAVMRGIEEASFLDRVVAPVKSVAGKMTGPTPVKNALSGAWLHHRLHPALTDTVVGTWLSAFALDVVGGKAAAPSADRLVAIGAVAAVPTAASGLSDWSDSAETSQHRVGLVHAAVNVTALGLQVASLVARANGNRGSGRLLSGLAFGSLLGGGLLGGHLSYVLGTGVDHPTGHLPADWSTVCALDDLAEHAPRTARVEGVEVVVVRTGAVIHGLAATCNHAGGPLGDGTLDGPCLTCPWHGSTFRLEDGGVVRGPAVTPQPSYETRVHEGQVQVRAT